MISVFGKFVIFHDYRDKIAGRTASSRAWQRCPLPFDTLYEPTRSSTATLMTAAVSSLRRKKDHILRLPRYIYRLPRVVYSYHSHLLFSYPLVPKTATNVTARYDAIPRAQRANLIGPDLHDHQLLAIRGSDTSTTPIEGFQDQSSQTTARFPLLIMLQNLSNLSFISNTPFLECSLASAKITKI